MLKVWFQKSKQVCLENAMYALYLVVLILVSYGILASTGTTYLPFLALFFGTFTLSYLLLKRIDNLLFVNTLKAKLKNFFDKNQSLNIYLKWGLVIFITFFIVYHFTFLGNVPAYKAYKSLDYYGIAFIRQAIGEHNNVFIKYMSAFIVKGFMPFLLLYLYIKDKRLFYYMLILSTFYAIALMQKSLIVTVLTPLVVYTLFIKKYLHFVFYSAFAIGGVYCLVYITNPEFRSTPEEITETVENSMAEDPEFVDVFEDKRDISNIDDRGTVGTFTTASGAIIERMFYTTGMVSTYWFKYIPSKYPHSGWCGYHFLTPFLDCDYDDYNFSRIIYDEVYKDYASRGFKGTVTVANFVYDYATFGKIGLAISGVVLAFFFLVVHRVFGNNYKWLICLNFLNVFWLSSGALSTLLLSGGWLIIIFMYLIFESELEKSLT